MGAGKNLGISRLYAPPGSKGLAARRHRREEDSAWLWDAVWGLEGVIEVNCDVCKGRKELGSYGVKWRSDV